jgi:hypothetical protein
MTGPLSDGSVFLEDISLLFSALLTGTILVEAPQYEQNRSVSSIGFPHELQNIFIPL